ncbi:MAG TPA: hypothetical protein VF071_03970 [Candidatus Limnocylindria bacterium]
MATTIGQRLVTQKRASHWVAAIAAGAAALILAGGLGLAVFISQAPAGTLPGPEPRPVSQVQHAAGRGFQVDLGSYTTSLVAGTSQANGYAAGKGGAMEYAGLELPAAAAPAVSQPRGGVLESADVR